MRSLSLWKNHHCALSLKRLFMNSFTFFLSQMTFALKQVIFARGKKVTFEQFQFLTSRSFSLGRVLRIPHSVGLRKNSLRGRRKIKKVMIEQKKNAKNKTKNHNIWLSTNLVIFHLKRKWSSSAWQTPGTCGPWTTLPVMLERKGLLSFEW